MGFFDNLSFAYYNNKSYTPSTLGEYKFSASNYNLYSPSSNYNYPVAEKSSSPQPACHTHVCQPVASLSIPPLKSFTHVPYRETFSDKKSFYSTTSNYSKYTLPTLSTTKFDLKSTPLLTFSNTLSKYNFSSLNLNNNYSFNNFNYSYTPYSSSYVVPTFNKYNFKPTQFKFKRANTGDLQLDLAQNATAYIGKVNSDRQGNRLFSNGKNQAWCADFVTHVTKETFGKNLPKSFGSSSVSGLRSWAQENNCYMPMVSSRKQTFIKENVRVGDIMIEKRNGKSHTGIVKEIASDGSWFKVVEGNSSNKVQTVTYAANSSTLSGFISLEKYCA